LIKNLSNGVHIFSIMFNHAGLFFKSITISRHP
jgi:hypothetical protein